MINLRFHVVSITAVFLSLAIGIFMGSSLLKRSTVDVLRSRLSSLEKKIDQRKAENDQFRASAAVNDARSEAFDTDVVPALVAGRLSAPVLVVAARGIDEDVVAHLQTGLTAAGATSLGTVWTGNATDMGRDEVRKLATETLGVDRSSNDADRTAVIDTLARALTDPAPTATDPAIPANPSTTNPWIALRDAGIVEWDAPSGGEVAAPPVGTLTVVVWGEGAEAKASGFEAPLVRRMAEIRKGAVVAVDTMAVRGTADEAVHRIDKSAVQRGGFVEPLRRDVALDGRLSTVDDLDHPEGRLAVVLALAQLPDRVGDYGELGDVDGPYPSLPA